MDVNRLSQGEKIAAGSAIVLFIVMFFSWFGVPDVAEAVLGAAGVDTSINAWQSFDFIDLILLLTIVVALGVAFLKASGNSVQPAGPRQHGHGAPRRSLDPPRPLPDHRSALGPRPQVRPLPRPDLSPPRSPTVAGGRWRRREPAFQDTADRLSTDRDRDREQRARERAGAGAAAPPPAEPPPGEPPSRSEPPHRPRRRLPQGVPSAAQSQPA